MTVFERAAAGLSKIIGNYADAGELDSFPALEKSIRLAEVFMGVPDLQGVNPDAMALRPKVITLKEFVAHITKLRAGVLAIGAAQVLRRAQPHVRACAMALKSAKETIDGITSLKRPSTMRELRAFAAAIPILRTMPPLPIGCEVEKMCGEQYSATVQILFDSSNVLKRRVSALPTGVAYSSLPSAADAKQTLQVLKDKQSSTFRVLSKDWRQAKVVLNRFAPKMDLALAVTAFEIASAIRADEETFTVSGGANAAR